ncbi:DUF2254 domain-containing protein [Neorhizobium sp. LjRoot104]|uniref:DUF2254 domain-containing protein n=1 Tax=Neorhizobium sp. LjRoot104 TaxID=3342254 RepID=UPI003ECC7319
MQSRWVWLISKVGRRIWFRATLFSLAAVATALVAIVAAPYIPIGLSAKIGADAVDNILGIIASSMLTVTTFSLSTMVSAYSAATTNVTPRATKLVMEDSTTQNVLATFIGSFLFSLVGIVALTTGAYGEQGRIVLFVVTILVIGLIVITLLRWIDHLSRLGRVTETTQRVEEATVKAIQTYKADRYLGGHPLPAFRHRIGKPNHPIFVAKVGYVQHLDAAALSDIAEEANLEIAILTIPGKLAAPSEPIAWVNREIDEDITGRIAACFSIGDTRSFDQDPRFGASVLSEIASRALSPAINDPGTAIDVISRAIRILAIWAGNDGADNEISHPRLYVTPIDIADLFDDLFTPIARDGAGLVEVSLRLQKALTILSKFKDREYRENAKRHSREALARAEAALTIDQDKIRLRKAALAGKANP